mmetsp:Transcript_8719/g.17730  ORF Transcript_8719/g.17730 Transcript_8719/m.17730 type:complete len:119 (-) Transcript_8719:592-948(-)
MRLKKTSQYQGHPKSAKRSKSNQIEAEPRTQRERKERRRSNYSKRHSQGTNPCHPLLSASNRKIEGLYRKTVGKKRKKEEEEKRGSTESVFSSKRLAVGKCVTCTCDIAQKQTVHQAT